MQHLSCQTRLHCCYLSSLLVIMDKGLKKSIIKVEYSFFFVSLSRLYFSISVIC